MLKFKWTMGKQKATTDSGSARSDVATDPQLTPTNSPSREESQTVEQPPAIEDSKSGSNTGSSEGTEDKDFGVKVDVHPKRAFFTKGFRKTAKSRSEDPSVDDVLGAEEEQTQASEKDRHLESGSAPGGESQPQSGGVFEPRGAKSQNTRVDICKFMKRIRDRIERDPRGTPSSEPRTDATPVASSAGSQAMEGKTSVCNRFCRPCKDCWGGFKNYWRDCRCRKRLFGGVICYTACLVACLVCAIVFVRTDWKELSACLMAVLASCSSVTLTFERGCFTYILDRKAKGKNSPDQEAADDQPLPACFFCLCCNTDIPMGDQRRSQYSRKETDTVFKCEAPDLSKIDVDEYPQVTAVEQTLSPGSESSGQSGAEFRLVAAIVHRSGTETEEANVSGCEHGCQGACACPKLDKKKKSKGKVAHSGHRKKSEKKVCERCGQGSPCACAGQARKQKSEVKDASLRRSKKIEDVSVCERCG